MSSYEDLEASMQRAMTSEPTDRELTAEDFLAAWRRLSESGREAYRCPVCGKGAQHTLLSRGQAVALGGAAAVREVLGDGFCIMG